MTQPRGWKPTLRYSPVNSIIVDWGINGQPFSMCCMPEAVCPQPSPVPTPPQDCCDVTLPMPEPVDTTDWYQWIPEIIVGLQDASEDMAASYARRAAIEFARTSRALQRQIAIRLQPGVLRYPLEPFEDESVQGVLRIQGPTGTCTCETELGAIDIGIVSVNVATQELRIQPQAMSCGCHLGRKGPEWILVTVWSAPTEDSCKHDVFLYDQYRREITLGARAAFIKEAHSMGAYKTQRGYANYRGDQAMFQRAQMLETEFKREMARARRNAVLDNEIDTHQPGALFATGCCTTRRH